jgi:phenylalanyl-tRNA synthetase beta chain
MRVGADVQDSEFTIWRIESIRAIPSKIDRLATARVCPADEASGVICGSVNFAVGDRVALSLPGAVLPGGFEVGARKTYGHISEGMICSASELALGDDHTGILVLPPDAPLGADFVAYAGLRDEVFEIAVTPDRGYAVSVRGLARELASAFSVPFTDPATAAMPDATLLGGDLAYVGPDVYPARIADPTACDRFVLREIRGFDPAASTPIQMMVRLAQLQHQVVGHVHGQRHRPHAAAGQPDHHLDRGAGRRIKAPDLAQHETVAGGRVGDAGGVDVRSDVVQVPAEQGRVRQRGRGRIGEGHAERAGQLAG